MNPVLDGTVNSKGERQRSFFMHKESSHIPDPHSLKGINELKIIYEPSVVIPSTFRLE